MSREIVYLECRLAEHSLLLLLLRGTSHPQIGDPIIVRNLGVSNLIPFVLGQHRMRVDLTIQMDSDSLGE